MGILIFENPEYQKPHALEFFIIYHIFLIFLPEGPFVQVSSIWDDVRLSVCLSVTLVVVFRQLETTFRVFAIVKV